MTCWLAWVWGGVASSPDHGGEKKTASAKNVRKYYLECTQALCLLLSSQKTIILPALLLLTTPCFVPPLFVIKSGSHHFGVSSRLVVLSKFKFRDGFGYGDGMGFGWLCLAVGVLTGRHCLVFACIERTRKKEARDNLILFP